jgi:hypothetical protein
MTPTTTPDQNTAIGPLSLKLHQEVWIVRDETPEKFIVLNYPDWLNKYVLKKTLETPCSPHFCPEDGIHLDEKSAWITIRSSLLAARQILDEKIGAASQHIANAVA